MMLIVTMLLIKFCNDGLLLVLCFYFSRNVYFVLCLTGFCLRCLKLPTKEPAD